MGRSFSVVFIVFKIHHFHCLDEDDRMKRKKKRKEKTAWKNLNFERYI